MFWGDLDGLVRVLMMPSKVLKIADFTRESHGKIMKITFFY